MALAWMSIQRRYWDCEERGKALFATNSLRMDTTRMVDLPTCAMQLARSLCPFIDLDGSSARKKGGYWEKATVKNELRLLLSGALAGSMSYAAPAWAQSLPAAPPSASTDTTIHDIIVTANKREETLNKVGATITALSGQALSERKITTLANISALVPGFTIAQSNSNTPILTLRGVGYNSAALGSYPAVSLYVDQFPLPFPILGAHSAYDLQRVEVLKGPQGTLFGENSTGGAVNFIAAKPTSTLQTGGDISYGRFNDVLGNVYVSGPLSDTLRARVAGTFENADGWQFSQSRPYDRNGKISYGAGRLLLDWAASNHIRFSLNVNGWVDKSQPQAPQSIGINPQNPPFTPAETLNAPLTILNPRAADWTPGEFAPRGDRKFYQIGLRTDIDLNDSVTLTSLTSYDHFTENMTLDYDGLPLLVHGSHETGTIKSFNQELRIANAATSRVRYVVGANYENSKTFDRVLVDFRDGSVGHNPNTNMFTNAFLYTRQNIRNIAGFGNLDFDVTSKLTVRGGVRYTDSRNRAQLCTGDGGDGRLGQLFSEIQLGFGVPPSAVLNAGPTDCIGIDPVLGFILTPSSKTLQEHNVSWRGGLDYKLSAQTLAYVNVSRGFKAGSYPLIPAVTTTQYTPVSQEKLTSYEAGIKTDLFNRHAHVNLSAFYYDYRDKQLQGKKNLPPFGPEGILINVPKSRIYGIEGDVTIRPTRGLTLGASATFLNTRIQRFNGFDAVNVQRDLSGGDLPYSPKFSYTIDAEYRVALPNGGAPFIGINVAGRSSQITTPDGNNIVLRAADGGKTLPGLLHPFTIAPYATIDARLGYEAPGGAWRVMVFGKNIFNKYYATNVVDQQEELPRYLGLPATYGVTFGFKFH